MDIDYQKSLPFFNNSAAKEKFMMGVESSLIISHFMSDIIGHPKLKFGKVNDRAKDPGHVETLANDFINKGVIHQKPIPLLVKKSWIGNTSSEYEKEFRSHTI